MCMYAHTQTLVKNFKQLTHNATNACNYTKFLSLHHLHKRQLLFILFIHATFCLLILKYIMHCQVQNKRN